MIELSIPELLPSLNRMQIGAHWSAWRSEKKRWNQWVLVAKHNQAKLFSQPRYERARIEIDRYCVKDITDHDNATAGLKWLQDSLVAHGLIKDDSVACIGRPEIRQIRCKKGEQKTVVRIYPLDDQRQGDKGGTKPAPCHTPADAER